PLATASRAEVTSVRALVHATIAERVGGIALVKTHNVLGHLGGKPIVNVAVSAGSIYIARDPRDIAPSLAKHLGAPIDEAIRVMSENAYSTNNTEESAFETWGSWSEHVHSWTMRPSDASLIVRYEDLMAKPTETFTAVAKHLRQHAATPEQIAEAIELSSFDKLKRQEDAYDFRERSPRADRFFASGKAGGWREKLTDRQAEAIVTAHSGLMRKFGSLN
ncbi:MAG: sulfotransferase domain-containing protein, partial [Bauldia sp.]|nr:sulfotransferase domain-containing protein [Bauldia sp.]